MPAPTSTRSRASRRASPSTAASTRRICAARWSRCSNSIDETLETARRADIPVVISHHKCAGPRNWGRTKETLPVIEAAAKRQPVGLDAYPYAAGSTNLRADLVTDEYRIMITWSRPHPEMTGRDLERHRARNGASTSTRRRSRLDPAGAIYFQMDETDVRARAALSAHDDRLGRPAARRSSASAALGHVSARARPLFARARPVPARDGDPQDDRPVGEDVPAEASAACSRKATSPTSWSSIRRR